MYIYFRTSFKFKTHLIWMEGVETSVRVRAVFSCLVSQILGTLATSMQCTEYIHWPPRIYRGHVLVRNSTTKYTRSRRACGRRIRWRTDEQKKKKKKEPCKKLGRRHPP